MSPGGDRGFGPEEIGESIGVLVGVLVQPGEVGIALASVSLDRVGGELAPARVAVQRRERVASDLLGVGVQCEKNSGVHLVE